MGYSSGVNGMTGSKETVSTCADNIKNRRSIRSYDEKSVSKEQIEHLIELAGMAPSVMNTQPWRFTVLLGDAREDALGVLRLSSIYLEEALSLLTPEELESLQREPELADQKIIDFFNSLGNAPAILVVTARRTDNEILRRQEMVSCGTAIQNLMLAANAEGLGTCCIGFVLWVEKQLLEVLNLGDSVLIAIISLGYPKDVPEAPKRRVQDINWVGP
jgi:nitroreductase